MNKKEKVKYTDEPMELGEEVENFLPPPDKLVLRPKPIRVTLTLDAETVEYFKAEAERIDVPYQRMIRNLLNEYRARMGRDNRVKA
jgi:predicted DNA binding CopG/RHH family protein